MKKFKFVYLFLVFAFFSCDNYLDVNRSADAVPYDELQPPQMLAGAQLSTFRVQSTTMNQLGNVFMNSWTRNVASYGNGYDRELQLKLDNSFYNGIWDGLYRNIMNFQGIIDFPNPNGQYDYYRAAALICKAHYTQYIVDLYGDAPFKEAWKGQSNLTPKYDDDYEIYKSLIADLEEARNIIDNPSENAEDISDKDIMMYGDMSLWTEFANTIELRMLVRMSNVTGDKATYRDDKLAEIASSSFLSQPVTINPGFTSNNDSEQNPFVNSFFYNSAGANQSNRTFVAMSGHAWKSLQSYASTNYPAGDSHIIDTGSQLPSLTYLNITDPRSSAMFTGGIQNGTTGPRRAVTQGSNVVDVASPTTSLAGPPCRLGATGHNRPYSYPIVTIEDYSKIDGFVMTLAESEFLQAEAAVRWPLLFSDEVTHFRNGIVDSFKFRNAGSTLALSTTSANNYFAAIDVPSKLGYSITNGTINQKINAILYQKWVALMGIHGIESYIDYTRTGFPITPLSTNASKSRKPYRLIYPLSEYIANSANVPNVSDDDCFVINSKTPFWVLGAPN